MIFDDNVMDHIREVYGDVSPILLSDTSGVLAKLMAVTDLNDLFFNENGFGRLAESLKKSGSSELYDSLFSIFRLVLITRVDVSALTGRLEAQFKTILDGDVTIMWSDRHTIVFALFMAHRLDTLANFTPQEVQ